MFFKKMFAIQTLSPVTSLYDTSLSNISLSYNLLSNSSLFNIMKYSHYLTTHYYQYLKCLDNAVQLKDGTFVS